MSCFLHLQQALASGNKKRILELLQEDFDLKSTDAKGNTLLHLAFKNETFNQQQLIEILEIFLDRGADIDIQNKQEKTILHLAVEHRMKDVVDFCLQRNADLNVKTKKSDTIAHFTIKDIYKKFFIHSLENSETYENESSSFVDWMVSRDFDFFLLKNIQQSPLYLATELNLQHILLTLLKRINELPVARRRQTALLRAFWESNVDELKAINRNGILKAIPSYYYKSRYVYDIVKIILEKTEFIDDNVLDNALILAVQSKAEMKVIELLAKRITNVNFRNYLGETTVETFSVSCHFYSEKDELAILRILLMKGANMKQLDLCQQTLPQKLFRSHPSMEMLKMLKEAGTDFNTCYYYPNEHFLNLVSGFGRDAGMADFIINETNCDINMTNFFEDTPLLLAIKRKNEFAAVELIERGAKIDVVDKYGISPLIAVCETGQIPVLEKLIEHGADFNYKNKKGETLLHLSVEYPKMVEFLLKKGLDVNAKDNNGKTPLYFAMTDAITNGKILLDIAMMNPNAKSVLAMAFESGQIEVLEKLIEYGADLNYKDKDGKTLLHLAVNYPKVLEVFVKNGLNVNAKDNNGKTAIAMACMMSQTKIIEMLIEYGADLNCRDKDDKTLLHLSAYDPKVAELLLKNGVEVNAKDNCGKTLLAVACETGQTEVIKLLLKYGGDFKYRGKDGKTLLHLVMNYSNLVELFLEKGLNVNAQDSSGKTPLHFAVDDEIVEILLNHGAVLDVLDKEEHTPLYDALCQNKTKSIEKLIKWGANIKYPKVFELAVKHFEEPYTINVPLKLRYLKRHLIKMTAAGLLDKMPYTRNGIGAELQMFLKQCETEVELLKTYFINDYTSLYDFMHKNLKCRCDYVENKILKSFLDDGANEKKFRNYFVMIKGSYNETIARKSLLDPAIDILSKLIKMSLPDLCIDRIFMYLNNIDLLNFIDSCKTVD